MKKIDQKGKIVHSIESKNNSHRATLGRKSEGEPCAYVASLKKFMSKKPSGIKKSNKRKK